MGAPLVEILAKNEQVEVFATSRKERAGTDVHWIKGNAHDTAFLQELLKEKFDAVVDFMVYTAKEFQQRYEWVLRHVSQYVFVSSARVYAPTEGVIDETSQRILDICKDQQYIQQELYDISKALQENMLIQSGYHNYTIVRPSLTYNDERLQFALYEKDEWLYRALHGQSIVFPENMKHVRTTMTWGGDVAAQIARLLCNEKALGEVFNTTCGQTMTWEDIWKVYARVLEADRGIKVKTFSNIDAGLVANKLNRYYQYIYARGIDRVVSNEKISKVIGDISYRSIEDGLSQCLHNNLTRSSMTYKPTFREAAFYDRLTHDISSMRTFSSSKQKLGYWLCRMGWKG